jgi:hypothetical protein
LLTKVDIREYLGAVLTEIIQRERIPLERRILDYWMKRAFYDVTEIIDLHGDVSLTEEELREKGLNVCIDSVNRKTGANGNVTVTYKFADKDRAAEMLQQFIGMIKPQTQKIEIAGLSDEARARLALLYDEETPADICPAVIDPQTEAPDDD